MIKQINILFLLLTMTWVFASCAMDDNLNDRGGQDSAAAITFAIKDNHQTRASKTGLETIVQDFRVYGVNGSLTNGAWTAVNKVMDGYKVWWNGNSAQTTETNSSDWEYVNDEQYIKYWDYDQPYHIFWGLAKADNKFSTAEVFDGNDFKTQQTIDVSEPQDNSASNCLYYTYPIVVEKAKYKDPVGMEFRCALSRVRLGFYEVISGYAVKEVKFYVDDNANVDGVCAAKGQFVSGGSLAISYDLDVANGLTAPSATIGYDGTPETKESHTFGALNYTFANDNKLKGEADSKSYIGVVSTAPTYAGSKDWPGYYTYILPYPNNDTPLTVKCDYTMVSTDGGGQEIKITGATASVPAEYCHWQSNHSYTYLFKLSANLQPITFVAYGEVSNTTNNEQGTITTIGEYSITTYQEGSVTEDGIEYKINKDMAVSVVNNTENAGPTYIKLTHATEPADGPGDYVIIYHQQTNKEWVVETDVSDNTAPSSSVYRETIECPAGSNSNGIDDKGRAHFTPDVTGTYRIEYWHKEADGKTEKLAVKIVKIKGEEVELEEYDKWQSGSSVTTKW